MREIKIERCIIVYELQNLLDSPATELSPTDSVVTLNTRAGIFAHQRIPARIQTGGFTELGELATRRAKRGAINTKNATGFTVEANANCSQLCLLPRAKLLVEEIRGSRSFSRATINKAYEVRGNASRVARRVIS